MNSLVLHQAQPIDEAARHRADISLLTTEEKDLFGQHEQNSLSEGSKRTYESDHRVFERWMSEHHPSVTNLHFCTWPVIMQWMQSMVDNKISEATIRRRFSFLRSHLCPSLKQPAVEQEYEKLFKGLIKSAHTDTQKGKRAILDDELIRILAAVDAQSDGGFDSQQHRMLLLFSWATALRRDEVRLVQWKHIQLLPGKGVSVHVPRSKTGEKSVGVNTRPGQSLDLLRALTEWKAVTCSTVEDFVFRGLSNKREMTSKKISDRLMVYYVKHGCELIGMEDVGSVAMHSLRAGVISSHARNGATTVQLMGLSRHKSLSSLKLYVKTGEFDHGL